MQRCLELARRGAGLVAPNPMVGALLLHENRIIGEGWHQRFGEAHAEVNCIRQAIQNGYGELLRASTLFVSLEPCAHVGKTPPCADLIIHHAIPRVVIGCRDPFPAVNGKGIEKLKAAGIDVQTGLLEKACQELNKRFFTFHTLQRPYVILKWAETRDGIIANDKGSRNNGERLLISNAFSNRLVHRWRSEEAAILVGTNTARKDDPALTNRNWTGPSPVRLVVDLDLKLPSSLQLFNRRVPTIVFNNHRDAKEDNLQYYRLREEAELVPQLLAALHTLHLQSVLVEGGARLLQSFIDSISWDEARVITNNSLDAGAGLRSPVLQHARLQQQEQWLTDSITTYVHA